MNYQPSTIKTISFISILSGIIAFVCLVLGAIAVNFNFDAFSNPSMLLTMPDADLSSIRLFLLYDLFGYYLLLLPAIFYIHDWMKTSVSLTSLFTFCGTSYVLVGAIGASILAVVWPSIISAYPTSSPAMQETLRFYFQTISDMVYGGMWNILEVLLGGIWWLAVGLFIRKKYQALGWITVILGSFTLLDGIGAISEVEMLSQVGLNIYLVLAPLWAIWFGIVIWKDAYRAVV